MVVTPLPVARPRGEVVWLESVAATDRSRVGDRAAALAEVALAHPVPPGFTIVGAVAEEAVVAAYAELGVRLREGRPAVALRPGHGPSVLGVRGPAGLLAALARIEQRPVFVEAFVEAD